MKCCEQVYTNTFYEKHIILYTEKQPKHDKATYNEKNVESFRKRIGNTPSNKIYIVKNERQ